MKEIISRVEVYFRLIKYSAVSVHRKLLESQLDWLGSQGKNNGCFDKRKKSNMLGLKFETDFSHYWWIRLRKNRWKCGRHQKLNPVVDTRFYSRRAAYYTCFNSEIHPETMARLWNAPTSFLLGALLLLVLQREKWSSDDWMRGPTYLTFCSRGVRVSRAEAWREGKHNHLFWSLDTRYTYEILRTKRRKGGV